MILHTRDPKDSYLILLELTNWAGYKANIAKPVAFSHAKYKHLEKKTTETILFTIEK